jgi:class 3 adenylate cyclase
MTGFVIVWGSNLCGELGIGSEEGRIFEPTLVPGALAEEHTVILASCSKDCTFVVTDTGEVFQAGLFNASGLGGFSRTFRRVPIEAKYVGGVAVGRSHVVYLIDQALTHLMAQLMEPRSGSAEAFVRKLLRLFQVAVANDSAALINGIQSRVNRLAAENDDQIPRTRLDQAVLSCVLQPGVKRKATHIVRVSNINNFRIECDGWWSLSDTSGGVEVTFSPATFVIEEGESVFMRIEVNLLDETRTSGSFQTLCQMSARRLRKKSSGSSGGFASHFFFVDVKFAEKDQERDPELVQHLVDTMSTYVPRSILYELNEDPTPPNGPRQVSFPGAILFIDVSGFTALNARLSALGPAGPEQVSMHLNRYFGELINAVNKHGGDVLKFAGDALICLFGSPNCGEDLSVLIQKAVQCGMEMQQGDLREYDSQQGFALTIHIGVGGGDIHWIYLGGVNSHYEHIIMGDPMLQLATAVDLSKTGEVVVSAEAFGLIKDKVKGEKRGENNFLVCEIMEEVPVAEAVATLATAEMEAGLRCFLPTSVLARIDALHMSWLAELRRVTVMFVNLTSLTYERGQQVQLEAINEVLCSMQRIVFRYEGMVRQFIVDDKGTVLIAVFGVPPFGHEDDAGRGMKTAWEIHHKLLESKVSNSIGVTTGKVFCGSVGSSKRQEYAMVGDIVNLSARLMGVAKNLDAGIIVDESTRDYTGDLVQYEVLEPVLVKGKEDPIPIAKPVGLKESLTEHHSHQNLPNVNEESRQATALPEIPMVARRAEMGLLQLQVAKLQARKQSAMDSRGSSTKTFLLSGNAGMGKTRIINELARLCRKQKVEYYIGQCNALEKTKPFFVFQTILEQLINLEVWKQQQNESGKEESHASRMSHWQGDSSTVAAAFGISKDSNWAEYLPLLNSVLPLGLPENQMCAKLDFDKKHMLTISFMAYLIQARATEKPVVLMVEDLQWIDASSMELLAAVAAETNANTKGVLIVLSQRSRPQHPHYKQLLQLTGVEELKLMPLSDDDCRQIACSTLGVSLSSWLPVLDKSTVKAHGNPLFAMEIAYSLRESGAVEVVEGKLVFNADAEKEMEIPETIEGMIGSRIDQLPSGPQLLLKVASVIGMEFSASMLSAIYPIPSQRNTIATSLKELLEVGLLERSGDSPVYRFKNDTVRDVTYMRMLFTQRQQLHEKIALYYEEQKNTSSDPRLVLALANHWRDALISKSDFDTDRVCRAASYLIAASGFLANEDNMAESSKYLEDAEKLIGMIPEDQKDQKEMIQRSVEAKRKTLAKKEAIQKSTEMWLEGMGEGNEESDEVIVFDEN